MIVGVGTDIVKIERMESSYARLGFAFVERFLTPDEQAVFTQRFEKNQQRGFQYLATRFAAKEALSKAIGTGIRDVVVWQNMKVVSDQNGQPSFELLGGLGALASEQLWRVHLSLSDDAGSAIAFVVLEKHS